ncbi:MAG: hypothetical protein IPJ74_14810 [Saprospiraceae bacterium]|nr:hypothetical protein [Saprospiraceae bacterium]
MKTYSISLSILWCIFLFYAPYTLSIQSNKKNESKSIPVHIKAPTIAAGVIYVNDNATGANNGSSWADAYNDLQDALVDAKMNGAMEIWVAEGIYYPDEGGGKTNNDRTASFALLNNVAIYGGFPNPSMANPNPTVADRNVAGNLTVLSGDIDQNDNQTPVVTNVNTVTGTTSNSQHIVTGSFNNSTSILDGFTITAGRADVVGFPDGVGGGMYVENNFATVRNCTFTGNFARTAGAIFVNVGALMLAKCTFTGNKAMFNGGAIYCDGNGGLVVNCLFSANEAGTTGGAVETTSSGNMTFINTVFSGNKAGTEGGAIYNDISSPDFYNCSFSGNNATNNGGAFSNHDFSDPTITNCILWGNSSEIYNTGTSVDPVVSYSIVQGNYVGMNNKDMNPLFVNQPAFASAPTATGDLRLQEMSPAIDMGNNAAVPADSKDVDEDNNTAEATPDLDLNERIFNSTVDIGAFELGCPANAGNIANSLSSGQIDICLGSDPNLNFTAQGAAAGGHTYRFILAQGDQIIQISSGDFDYSILSVDNYTVYGLWYSNDNTPMLVTDYLMTKTLISQIQADEAGDVFCLDLSNTAAAGQTTTVNVYDPSIYLGGIVYVDENAVGNNDGTSWTDAFTNLQDALVIACGCGGITQIWVADGIYYPDEGGGKTNNDRMASFALCNNVAIYGGFAGTPGTEGDFNVRDINANLTVLSGDIDQNDNQTPLVTDINTVTGTATNSLHIIVSTVVNATPILDGFTITAGRADIQNSFPNGNGAAMLITNNSPTVRNCTFAGNFALAGGAIYMESGVLMLVKCTFTGNKAMFNGGAIYCDGNGGLVVNCLFSANEAGTTGGAVETTSSGNMSLINTVFSGNKAGTEGGAIYNDISSPDFYNCSFSGNNATNNGGAFSNHDFSDPTITNCILWGNSSEIYNTGTSVDPVVSYSIVQGNYVGMNNKDMNPLFVNQPAFASAPTATGDLRLQEMSPAIDMGNNAAVPADSKDVDEDNNTVEPTPDLDMNERISNTTVDMGAFEFTPPCDADAGTIENSLQTDNLTICEGIDPGFTFDAINETTDPAYLYTFLLVDGSNAIVETAINGDFDLAALNAGTYTVYGLSYANTNTPDNITDYLNGKNITDVQTDDAGVVFCLNLTATAANGHTNIIEVNGVDGGAIGNNQTVCSTKIPQALIETQVSSGSGTITYRWERSIEGCNSGFETIDGETGTSLTFTQPLVQTTYFRRVTISTQNGVICETYSNCVIISVAKVDCGTFPWNGNE